MRKGDGPKTLALPNKHKRADIGRPLLKRILDQADIPADEWTGESNRKAVTDDECQPTD
jgi:hypothetical protein